MNKYQPKQFKGQVLTRDRRPTLVLTPRKDAPVKPIGVNARLAQKSPRNGTA